MSNSSMSHPDWWMTVPQKGKAALLYCLGEEAEAVMASTTITEEECGSYDTVISKFEDFFKFRRNVIFEHARFNRRNQLEGESAEKYTMELYCLRTAITAT